MVQFPRADSKSDTIRLEGNEAVVEKILVAIQSFVSERENRVTDVVDVAPARHGLLIGRGGETRKSLESEFKVSISIPNTSATGPARSGIKISGTAEDVELAKQRILSMVEEPAGETILVPRHLHHVVAESNSGNLFRNLSRNLRVTVDHAGQQRPAKPTIAAPTLSAKAKPGALPLITDDAQGNEEELSLNDNHVWELQDLLSSLEGVDMDATIPWVFKGSEAANVAKARQIVETAVAEARESVTGYLVLPDPKMCRYVIGQGGSTVSRIRKETGCKIEVPKGAAADEPIEIRGKRAAVEQAKDMVLEAVAAGMTGRRY